MTEKTKNFETLARAAKNAQKASKDLDSVLLQLENRHISLSQAVVKLGAGWARTYGDLDTKGKALVSLFEILGNTLQNKQAPNVPSFNNSQPSSAALSAPPINVQLVTNSIADIQRGESQLSSLLARAVSRGMRQL